MFETTGIHEVTVTDTLDATVDGKQIGIDVTPAMADYYTVTGITDPIRAGELSNVTVTVYDRFDNIVTDYLGTIHFTSTDADAALPLPDYPFTALDAGTHTFTNGVMFETTGIHEVTVTDTVDATVDGKQIGIDVTPAMADYYTVTGITDPIRAGELSNVTVTVYDRFDNIVTDYLCTIHFTSTDADAALPLPDYPFTALDAGTHTFTN